MWHALFNSGEAKLWVRNVSECKETRVCNNFGEHIMVNNSKLISVQFEVLVSGDVIYNFMVLFVTTYNNWVHCCVGGF